MFPSPGLRHFDAKWIAHRVSAWRNGCRVDIAESRAVSCSAATACVAVKNPVPCKHYYRIRCSENQYPFPCDQSHSHNALSRNQLRRGSRIDCNEMHRVQGNAINRQSVSSTLCTKAGRRSEQADGVPE